MVDLLYPLTLLLTIFTLKVGKARYGEPFAVTKNDKEERELLAAENQNLKEKIKMLLEQPSNPPSLLSKIDHAFRFLQEGTFFEPLIEPFTTNFKMVRNTLSFTKSVSFINFIFRMNLVHLGPQKERKN